MVVVIVTGRSSGWNAEEFFGSFLERDNAWFKSCGYPSLSPGHAYGSLPTSSSRNCSLSNMAPWIPRLWAPSRSRRSRCFLEECPGSRKELFPAVKLIGKITLFFFPGFWLGYSYNDAPSKKWSWTLVIKIISFFWLFVSRWHMVNRIITWKYQITGK